MSLLDSIVKKGEDLASAGLQMGSDLVHAGADLLQKGEQAAVSGLHTVENAVVNNVVKPVEKAVTALAEPAEHLGEKLVHEAYEALKVIPKAVVQAMCEPVGLISAIIPGAALVAIGFNTWRDLTNGSTVKVDQTITAEQELKASGLSVSASSADGKKLDLNGIFQRAESGTVSATVTDGRVVAKNDTTGGGGADAGAIKPGGTQAPDRGSSSDSSAAFNLISRSEWASILPDLTAPAVDAPASARNTGTDQTTTQLPKADVGQSGIDFNAKGSAPGKLEIVNGTVFYRNSEASVEAKNGHFSVEQSNGYTFKDDGNGGRVVYHNGVQVYDQHKDGTREFSLPGGVKLLALGDNLTVVDDKGKTEYLTRDLVNQALEHRVGRFRVQQTAEQFTAALARKLPSSQTVMLGADFVELEQGPATAIIRDSGEAFAYTDTEVLHRDANGKWYYKATKTAPEKEIKLADLSSTTSDAALIALAQKVDQLIGNGNAEIAGQQMQFRRGRIQTNLRDLEANQSATLLVTNNESAITDNSTGLTWTRQANSHDSKLSLAGKQLATVTDGKDDKVTTAEVISTNEKTTVADGSVIHKDMSMDLSSGIHVSPKADVRLADGTTIGHDGIVRTAQGDTINSQAIAQQINNTMAAAASALASVGSGSGVSMARIIELESLLGSVNGLLAMCSSVPAEISLANNLAAFSGRLESTISTAKDNFTKQSGRQFVEEQNGASKSNYNRFAFLTKDVAA